MKKLILITILLLPLLSMAQSVSVFVGASSANNLLYGAELKTSAIGLFIERLLINKAYSQLSKPINANPTVLGSSHDVVYEGLMFGANAHMKGLTNVLISVGVGILNKHTIYYVNSVNNTNGGIVNIADNDMVSVNGRQLFAFEVSCGKDFEINNKVIIGIKGGVNSRTDIFGTVSLGYRF